MSIATTGYWRFCIWSQWLVDIIIMIETAYSACARHVPVDNVDGYVIPLSGRVFSTFLVGIGTFLVGGL